MIKYSITVTKDNINQLRYRMDMFKVGNKIANKTITIIDEEKVKAKPKAKTAKGKRKTTTKETKRDIKATYIYDDTLILNISPFGYCKDIKIDKTYKIANIEVEDINKSSYKLVLELVKDNVDLGINKKFDTIRDKICETFLSIINGYSSNELIPMPKCTKKEKLFILSRYYFQLRYNCNYVKNASTEKVFSSLVFEKFPMLSGKDLMDAIDNDEYLEEMQENYNPDTGENDIAYMMELMGYYSNRDFTTAKGKAIYISDDNIARTSAYLEKNDNKYHNLINDNIITEENLRNLVLVHQLGHMAFRNIKFEGRSAERDRETLANWFMSLVMGALYNELGLILTKYQTEKYKGFIDVCDIDNIYSNPNYDKVIKLLDWR